MTDTKKVDGEALPAKEPLDFPEFLDAGYG